MKKRIKTCFLFLAAVILVLMTSQTTFAEAAVERISDNASLLSEQAYETADERVAYYSDKYGVDLFVLTESDCDDTEELAFDYFNENYRYGRGFVLVLNEKSSYSVSADIFSYGETGVTGAQGSKVLSLVKEYVSDREYAKAIEVMAGYCTNFTMAAENGVDYGYAKKEIPSERMKPLLVDLADLLDAEEEESLLSLLEKKSDELEADIVVVTTDFIGDKSDMEFADDFFDYNGYGRGKKADGILLLISRCDRGIWISTSGKMEKGIHESDVDAIIDEMIDDIAAGNYYSAFQTFPKKTISCYKSNIAFNRAMFLFFGLIIALIIAGSTTNTHVRALKSVSLAKNAANYLVNGSFNLQRKEDRFLYKQVTKTKVSSSSSGSGSHSSSSGRSHGGGGRHY